MIFGSLPLLTAGYVVSTLLTVSTGVFVLYKNSNSKSNLLFFLLSAALAIFDISFLLAINTSNLETARILWMANIANVFIAAFYAHWIFSIIDRNQPPKEGEHSPYKGATIFIYVLGGLLAAACLVFNHLWMADVLPRLYLNSFMVAGPLYAAMVLYFLGVSSYAFWKLYLCFKTGNPTVRNRSKYFLTASAFGFLTGITAFPLSWGIPIDPILSMLTALYVIPLAYGMLKENIMDFRVLTKRAAVYGLIIFVISAILVGISLLNQWIITVIPWLGLWTIPLIAGTIAFFVGRFYWRKLKETDDLKYEFVTVAAHKLRTPLTRIKWGISILNDIELPLEDRKTINAMNIANDQLIQISDVILDAAETSGQSYQYDYKSEDFVEVVKEAIKDASANAVAKNINLAPDIPYLIPPVLIDKKRIISVLEVFLENAISYTPEGGSITISVYNKEGFNYCAVTDTGMGITKAEQHHIFGRFYRGERALLADTEGIGIGLYMSHNIVKRHNGKIGVYSDGIDKGSTFWFAVRAGELSEDQKPR